MTMDLLPPLGLLWPFLLAGLALILTPGADMTFVATSGARDGRRAGVAAAVGVFVGCLAHILLAVIGLSALIAASQTAFTVLKWAGAAYLLWLAIQLVRAPAERERAGRAQARTSWLRTLRDGALVNLLNPKVGVFFLAFLPQFVDPRAGSHGLQILTHGLLFNLGGLAVNVVVGLGSALAAPRAAGIAWVGRAARWLAASLLGLLALRLATGER